MNGHDLTTLLIGESPAMTALREYILKVAPAPLAVLIQGPTGAGKELVAHAIHQASRRPGRFTPLHVGSLPDSLFADAMFGHCRGAFTGAVESTQGCVAEAERGTLFLDEIGTLSLASQAALLRVLETRTYRQLGGRTDRQCDFRVVSATNVRLPHLVRRSEFREDLMYRLRGVVVTVPALRERLEDIPCLAQHFAGRVSAHDGPVRFTESAIRALQQYEWPGNVRQLKSVIESAAYIAGSSLLDDRVIHTALGDDGRGLAGSERIDRTELCALLDRYHGDVKCVATHYGKTVGTIYRWLREHGIPTWERQRRPTHVKNTTSSETRLERSS